MEKRNLVFASAHRYNLLNGPSTDGTSIEETFLMGREQAERKYPRKPIHRAYVEYSKAGTRLSRLFKPDVQRGPMVDVSKNGVQFRTTEPLQNGDALYMTLRFPNVRETVKVKVEVRWVREEKRVGIENYTHVVGAEFLELTPKGWDLITAALKE
jgi:hypothetical protein